MIAHIGNCWPPSQSIQRTNKSEGGHSMNDTSPRATSDVLGDCEKVLKLE